MWSSPNVCSVRSFDLDAKEPEDEDREPRTVIVGRALVALCKSHLGSWAGTDVDELVDCAGQYVMYNPQMAQFLLGQLLSSWPRHSSEQQVLYLRVVVRVLMASVDGSLSRTQMALRVFERLVKLLLDGQVQVRCLSSHLVAYLIVNNVEKYVSSYSQSYSHLLVLCVIYATGGSGSFDRLEQPVHSRLLHSSMSGSLADSEVGTTQVQHGSLE